MTKSQKKAHETNKGYHLNILLVLFALLKDQFSWKERRLGPRRTQFVIAISFNKGHESQKKAHETNEGYYLNILLVLFALLTDQFSEKKEDLDHGTPNHHVPLNISLKSWSLSIYIFIFWIWFDFWLVKGIKNHLFFLSVEYTGWCLIILLFN